MLLASFSLSYWWCWWLLILKELDRINRTGYHFTLLGLSQFSLWLSNSLRCFLLFSLWQFLRAFVRCLNRQFYILTIGNLYMCDSSATFTNRMEKLQWFLCKWTMSPCMVRDLEVYDWQRFGLSKPKYLKQSGRRSIDYYQSWLDLSLGDRQWCK